MQHVAVVSWPINKMCVQTAYVQLEERPGPLLMSVWYEASHESSRQPTIRKLSSHKNLISSEAST